MRYNFAESIILAVEKTVKDIVQMLVADGLIQSDKIGSSNCNIFSTL